MAQIIHVIKPNGTRFEFAFGDNDPPEKILKALADQKQLFGRGRVITATDETFGHPTWKEDPTAPWAFDDAGTAVVLGTVNGEEFVESKRLKGPPKPPEPTP